LATWAPDTPSTKILLGGVSSQKENSNETVVTLIIDASIDMQKLAIFVPASRITIAYTWPLEC
jgi:hypothetical protein